MILTFKIMLSMKKSMFLMALAAMSLVSCSNDNVVEVPQPDAIKFNVMTQVNSRAANLYGADAKMNFNVYAAYKGSDNQYKSYIQGDLVEYNAESGKWENRTTRYWADGGSLDFYAVVGTALDWNVNATTGAAPSIKDYTVGGADWKNQEDLLYAVKKAQTKEANAESGVKLNFRHALAQVAFKAVNKSTAFHVVVKSIEIGNINSKGTFTLPSADTDPNVTATATEINNQGSWGDTPSTPTSYTLMLSGGVVTAEKDLTVSKDDAMLLIPQTVAAWNKVSSKTPVGAYVKVDCEIWNVSDQSKGYQADIDVPLHIGKAVMPLPVAWEQGKKYTYTFEFGGTTPGGGYEDDQDDPQEIIQPISFSVSVDEFVPVPNDNPIQVVPTE